MTTPEHNSAWQKTIEDMLTDHARRISDIEKSVAVFTAVASEQARTVQDRFNRVEDNIQSTKEDLKKEIAQTKTDLNESIAPIKSGINKVLWAVILGVLAVAVQWVLKGGLVLIN